MHIHVMQNMYMYLYDPPVAFVATHIAQSIPRVGYIRERKYFEITLLLKIEHTWHSSLIQILPWTATECIVCTCT